ncbi:hypothetical protein [Kitasatospora cineracea]|uniref:YbaB/EbfC DNA-binding family protein n=1 Tax=Kitasatospora cineracea TaxID=88074 RepID=A0A3N4RE23_9ACTN|nr:hypothetical protein [Kitasatospora cineracea]RPE26597.1 hypothetical protein EDD38_7658 [Kitasatospora cineracea]
MRIVSAVLRRLSAALGGASAASGERAADGPQAPSRYTTEQIEAAALVRLEARQQQNDGAREQRRADKVLSTAPAGTYGSVRIAWVESSRRDWDREAIAATFARLGEEIPTVAASARIRIEMMPETAGTSHTCEAPDAPEQAPPSWVDDLFGAYRPAALAA